MTTTGTPQRAPDPLAAFGAVFHLFLRGQLTRLRSLGLGLLSSLSVLLAFIARASEDPLGNAASAVAGYGLGVVLPVCTLWVASGLIGDLAEDRLLAYLWLKPIGAWVIPTAAVAATATIIVPLVVIPLAVAAAVSTNTDLFVSTLVACLLGMIGYGGIFVALSARFARALWFGLTYILVWENAIARISDGTSRLAIRSYIHSVVERATGVDIHVADRAAWSTYTVPLVLGIGGIGLATLLLKRRDID
jgi:ABC-2 type transport system permease protein